MHRVLWTLNLVGVVLAISTLRAQADALMVTRAMSASSVMEVFVEENHVRVELEIGARDLAGFWNLLPEKLLELSDFPGAGPLTERLPTFFARDLVFRADDGPPLPGRVVSMEGRKRIQRDDITGDPLPVQEDPAETVIFAILEYRFSGQPAALHMKPPQQETGMAPAATVGFMTYHHGVPVMDFRYLGREEILDLDWEDPWYSQFRNRNLWRQYREPINVFLYVEPYEVRAEIIVRPFDLQRWVDLGLQGQRIISASDQANVMEAAASFLADRLNLTIDGQPFSPALDRVNFLRRTLRNSTVVDPPEDLDVYSATLGVIFVQPTLGLPQTAAIHWDLFSPKMDRVRAAATDEAGPLPAFLTREDTALIWKNFLKNPTIPTLAAVDAPPPPALRWLGTAGWGVGVLSLVVGLSTVFRQGARSSPPRTAAVGMTIGLCAGIALVAVGFRLSDRYRDQIHRVVPTLLRNVYLAFDYRDEERIYDTLAHSVAGTLLNDIYLETRQSLELANQGGARVKVKDIEVQRLEIQPAPNGDGFVARCTWNVRGSVGHWGHIHQRVNQYEADLTLQPVEGTWKLTEVEILEEARVS